MIRFYDATSGRPRLVGWKIGPLRFGVAKDYAVVPEAVLPRRFGGVVLLVRGKPQRDLEGR